MSQKPRKKELSPTARRSIERARELFKEEEIPEDVTTCPHFVPSVPTIIHELGFRP